MMSSNNMVITLWRGLCPIIESRIQEEQCESQIQPWNRVAGLALQDRVRTLRVWESPGADPVILWIERSQLSGVSLDALQGHLLVGNFWMENLEQMQEPLERLYLTVGFRTSGDLPGGAGICGWGEWSLNWSCQPVSTATLTRKRGRGEKAHNTQQSMLL